MPFHLPRFTSYRDKVSQFRVKKRCTLSGVWKISDSDWEGERKGDIFVICPNYVDRWIDAVFGQCQSGERGECGTLTGLDCRMSHW